MTADATCTVDITPANTNGPAIATDNCDGAVSVTSSDVSTQTSDGSCTDYSYVITRTWVATDECGNSMSCEQTITVEDTTAPTITTCPADITLTADATCTVDITPGNTNGPAVATDNCDGAVTVTSSDVSTQTSDGSCTDYSYIITRTWVATDECGCLLYTSDAADD